MRSRLAVEEVEEVVGEVVDQPLDEIGRFMCK